MYAESPAFNIWAKEEGLWQRENISIFAELADPKVAFDAEDYLYSFLSGGQATYEPLLPALGGIPFTLESHVDALLEDLRNAKIKPIFVFPGGGTVSQDRRTASREGQKALTNINDAWNVYTAGRGEDAVKEFGRACEHSTILLLDFDYRLTCFRHIPHEPHPSPSLLLSAFERRGGLCCSVRTCCSARAPPRE